MKSNFDKCLAMLLEHEGGFTADKRDKGNAGDGMATKDQQCLVSPQGSTLTGQVSQHQ